MQRRNSFRNRTRDEKLEKIYQENDASITSLYSLYIFGAFFLVMFMICNNLKKKTFHTKAR